MDIRRSPNPKVSFIILNYNQIEITLAFLESTRQLTYTNYEILLVDNCSKTNPEQLVKEKFPNVIFIRSEENLGFTGGNNLAMEQASGDYLFVINNDTEVTPSLLERMLEPFNDPAVGVVSPKIMYFSDPKVIQYAGFTKINPITGRNKCVGDKEIDSGQYDQLKETNYAHGAGMLVKREVVDKVGMFYDKFFIYYEELDWSQRIIDHGYKIIYQPSAVLLHKESMTMGKESPMKSYFHNRNRVLFMRRHSSGSQYVLFILFFALLVVPKNILKYLSKGQFQYIRNLFSGIVWNLQNS